MTQEKSSEALLEAWSASVMTMEHMEVAVEDQHFLEHLLENVALGPLEPSNEHCGNLTMLAQEVYLAAQMVGFSSEMKHGNIMEYSYIKYGTGQQLQIFPHNLTLSSLLHHQINHLWKQHAKKHGYCCFRIGLVDPPNLNSAAERIPVWWLDESLTRTSSIPGLNPKKYFPGSTNGPMLPNVHQISHLFVEIFIA